jgi:alpha-galactosidase
MDLSLSKSLFCVMMLVVVGAVLPASRAEAQNTGPVIRDAWWTGVADRNGDGCFAPTEPGVGMRLNWDPDAPGEEAVSVTERVCRRIVGAADWILVSQTAPHPVSGISTNDAQFADLPPGMACVAAEYRIEIHRAPAGGGAPTNFPPALLPPMGFCSFWYNGPHSANSNVARLVMESFVTNGWRELGYRYIGIDDGSWMTERDPASGKLVTDAGKFPGGMKAFADYVHSQGFLLGLYAQWPKGQAMATNRPVIAGYEELDGATLACDFDADYIKYDIIADTPEDYERIDTLVWRGIQTCATKPVLLKSSFGGLPLNNIFHLEYWPRVLNLWCYGDTLGYAAGNPEWAAYGTWPDRWWLGINRFCDWAYHSRAAVGPGRFADCNNGAIWLRDLNVARTDMGLACVLTMPVILTAAPDPANAVAFATFGNPEAIAILRDPGCLMAEIVNTNADSRVYVKPLGTTRARDGWAVGLANRSMTNSQVLSVNWADLGLPASTLCSVRDVWDRRDLESRTNSLRATIPPKGFGLYKITVVGGSVGDPPSHVRDSSNDEDLADRREQSFAEDNPAPPPPRIEGLRVTPGGALEFRVFGQPGRMARVEISTNLVSWLVHATVENTAGGIQFSYPLPEGHGARFFRARPVP